MNRSASALLDRMPAEMAVTADSIANDIIGRLNRARDHVLDPRGRPLSGDPLEQRLAKSLGSLKGRLKRDIGHVSTLPKKMPPRQWNFRGVTEAQALAAAEQLMSGDLSGLAISPRAIVNRQLNINSLTCVQDTLEPGKDDMVVGTVASAIRVLADGTISIATQTRETDLGKFKKGDSTVFSPPLSIATFEQIETPTILSVHLVLAETDLAGGVGAVLRDLVDGVENRLNGKSFTAFFSSASALVAAVPLAMYVAGGPNGIGAIVAWVVTMGIVAIAAAIVGALLFALFKLFRDEIFPTETVALSLDAAGGVDGGTAQPIALRFSRNVAVYDADIQFA